ncbi:MAG TPA: hypothetical protein VMC03_21445 [Streptosporangiaceae bacterium]|nr:hypothetical protein [Streptosporangiaceae bacterium]
MTANQAATATPARGRPDHWRDNLARGNLAAVILLLIQYGLGMGVNLYVTLPAAGSGGRDIGKAFTSGPALAVHAVLGLLLILMAISMIVRAAIARHRASIVTSAVGLLAILAAAGYGASFVHDSTNAASFGMALATGVALLSYAIGLLVTRRPAAGGTS